MKYSPSSQITSRSRSNLALAFFCLPTERRQAMSIFYAFCRVVDDIVDQEPRDIEKSKAALNHWRRQIEFFPSGKPTDPLACELAEVVHQYNIPQNLLLEIIDGMEMDLAIHRYPTFPELEKYCYRVASVVGLVSIRIFGCTNPQSSEYAIALGMALQLTNILRDAKYDFTLGRIYLPQDEMRALGVHEDDFKKEKIPNSLKTLFHLQYLRARHFFNKARRLISPEDRPKLIAAQMMANVYSALLERLNKQHFNITPKPLRLTKFQKASIVLKTLIYSRLGRNDQRPYVKGLFAPPARIAIWGGGFAGLSAAVQAILEGHSVDLYEAKSYWGGRAHSFRQHKIGDIIDNSQHIFMGCYTSCLELFNLLGVIYKLKRADTLDLHFHSNRGFSRLHASHLPAPLHLLTALMDFKEISWSDRLCILWLGLRMRMSSSILPTMAETVQQWLKRGKQTPGAIRALWEPLCLAALNEPLCSASASLFYNVLKQSIFGQRNASAIYLNEVGLSELLMPEIEILIRSTGGQTYLGCSVNSIQWNRPLSKLEDDEAIFSQQQSPSPECSDLLKGPRTSCNTKSIRQIQFQKRSNEKKIASFTTSTGQQKSYDLYISALPPKALVALLPKQDPHTRKLGRIPTSPIVGIHLWTHTRLIDIPILGLLDSPLHWIFDRTTANQKPSTYLYSLVISGAGEIAQKSSAQILELALDELEKHFPHLGKIEVIHNLVYKSLDATFAATPGTEILRPDSTTPWSNLFLVGDWVDTGLPATLESAAQSAQEAGFFADFAVS